MSWEGTLKKRRGLGDGMPNSVGIGRIQSTLRILKKVRDGMQVSGGPADFPADLLSKLPTMREMDEMLEAMEKVANAPFQKYLLDSQLSRYSPDSSGFMARSREALEAQRAAERSEQQDARLEQMSRNVRRMNR